MKRTLFSLVILIFSLSGKNLSILHSGALINNELLDIYIHKQYAFIPGGLGGLNIVDISTPENPIVVGTFSASGCSYGRIYAWAVNGNYAYGTGRECGIKIININDISTPIEIASYSAVKNTGSIRYEHPAIMDDLLFAARHQSGVEILSLANPELPLQVAIIPTDNAWSSLPDQDLLFIADGSAGIKIVDISNPNEPQLISGLLTSGTAKDLALKGDFLFVANGAGGVDMIDVSNPGNPILVDSYNTSGYAAQIAVNDSLISVADWDDVEILSFSSGQLELVGYKNSSGRVMAIALKDNVVFSAEWSRLTVYQYGTILGADLDYSDRKIEFPRVANGTTHTLSFTMQNSGQSSLIITDFEQNNNNISFEIPTLELAPNSSQDITVSYTPENTNWISVATFQTNDPDESVSRIFAFGNFPYGPMPGDHAPYFNLDHVDDNGYLSLDDLRGQPAVIAFFTAW